MHYRNINLHKYRVKKVINKATSCKVEDQYLARNTTRCG